MSEEDLHDDGWLHIPDFEKSEWKTSRKYLYPAYLFGSVTLGVSWIALREIMKYQNYQIVDTPTLLTTTLVGLSLVLGNGSGLYITGKVSEMINDIRFHGQHLERSERSMMDGIRILLMWLLGALTLAVSYDLVIALKGGLL